MKSTYFLNLVSTDCPHFTTASSLPDEVACHVSDTCGSLQCCIDVPLIKRSVEMSVTIDQCLLTVDVQLEQFHRKFDIKDLFYGTKQHFSLLEFVNIG